MEQYHMYLRELLKFGVMFALFFVVLWIQYKIMYKRIQRAIVEVYKECNKQPETPVVKKLDGINFHSPISPVPEQLLKAYNEKLRALSIVFLIAMKDSRYWHGSQATFSVENWLAVANAIEIDGRNSRGEYIPLRVDINTNTGIVTVDVPPRLYDFIQKHIEDVR